MYQGHLEKVLKTVFPHDNILVNTRKQAGIKHNTPTGTYLELDVWIPTLNLGFEFQDAHHYITTWYYNNSQEESQKLDQTKFNFTRRQGITFFEVPCWWDGAPESLVASIHFQRPDLVEQSSNDPIALNVSPGFFRASDIPEVGELMQASFPTATNISVRGNVWWMGEKYDGIRCCWHPANGTAYTRTSTALALTSEVIVSIPHFFLDGEFWFGRGLYAHTYMLFKGSAELVRWHSMRLVAFDNPAREYLNMSFEMRYRSLLKSVDPNHPFVVLVPRVMCLSEEHMQRFVKGILEEGGEGVILRRVGSLYEHGRSTSLLKLKSAQEDTEGIVLSVDDKKCIQIKLPNGSVFTVPAQNVHVAAQLGDVVTFSYESNSRRDAPVNPVVYRIRTDLDWDDLVLNYAKEKRHLSTQSRIQNFTAQAKGHWTTQTMRNYLINFAKKRNLNPLAPQTWYQISYDQLYRFRGGRTILQKFKGYVHALRGLFPDIKFDASIIRNAWHNEGNRRKFFEDYAKENGFNPLVPENWYSRKFSSIKGASGVIEYHNKSMVRALLDLFPDIGLDKAKWAKASWVAEKARRKFFLSFAKEKGFDPLIPENWYLDSIPYSNALRAVVAHHKGSIAQALRDLFPNIGLDPSKIKSRSKVWTKKENRRLFFENYANAHGFDPLNPENWKKQSKDDIMAMEGAPRVVSYHENSPAKALADLFPEIELKHLPWSNNNWNESLNRKRFFEKYARDNRFDPLNADDWYLQSIPKMLATKGMSRVISFYGHNLTTALLELFPNIGLQKSKMWRSPKSRNQIL